MNLNTLKRYYSTREVADLLGLNCHQVWEKAAQAEVGHQKAINKRWRFTKEDIEKIKLKIK